MSRDGGDWTPTTGDGTKKFVRTSQGARTGNAAILDKAIASGAGGGILAHAKFNGNPGLVALGAYTDVNNNTNKNIGSIPDKLDRIFNVASNVDLLPIDVSIEAGLGTVFAVGQTQTVSAYDDTAFVDVDGSNTGFYTTGDNMTGSTQINIRDNYRTIFNKFETFARSTRKDHIFVADVLKPLVLLVKS